MAIRLSGIWFKLVEDDGFYLGILLVPEPVADGLEMNSRWRVGRGSADYYALPKAARSIMKYDTIQCIDFVRADHLMPGAIMVFGISLSDLNRERGFAFVPSAEYMQRGPVYPRAAEIKKTVIKDANSRFAGLEFVDE